MASFVPVAGFAIALALAAALLQELAQRRAQHRERVIARVEAVSRRTPIRRIAPRAHGVLDAWLERTLGSLGIAPAPWHLPALRGTAVLLCAVGAWGYGPLGAVIVPGAGAVLAGLELGRRRRRRRAQLLAQLPGFVDHVARAVQAGSSVPHALASATAESAEPLRGIFERVDRQTRRGAGLEEALEQAAAGHDLRQLDMLALVIRLNQRYGGSIREILTGIVTMIRQHERAQREALALTAETRLSAWVLVLLPIALGLYIVWMNPGYLQRMWTDPTGRSLLSVAAILQGVGSLLLWRMVKSV